VQLIGFTRLQVQEHSYLKGNNMGHYAKVVNDTVERVIVAKKEFFDTFKDSSPGQWIKTSYNTHGNIHYGADGEPDGGTAIRGNYAGAGYIYNREHDVFYPPQPHPSWSLNTSTWTWQAPLPYPNDEEKYIWNESTLQWVRIDSVGQ
jgi:hypothetical protein